MQCKRTYESPTVGDRRFRRICRSHVGSVQSERVGRHDVDRHSFGIYFGRDFGCSFAVSLFLFFNLAVAHLFMQCCECRYTKEPDNDDSVAQSENSINRLVEPERMPFLKMFVPTHLFNLQRQLRPSQSSTKVSRQLIWITCEFIESIDWNCFARLILLTYNF